MTYARNDRQEHPRPVRRRFQLTLSDAGGPDDVDVIHRLRSLLKSTWRNWKIRCERIVELDASGRAVEFAGTDYDQGGISIIGSDNANTPPDDDLNQGDDSNRQEPAASH